MGGWRADGDAVAENERCFSLFWCRSDWSFHHLDVKSCANHQIWCWESRCDRAEIQAPAAQSVSQPRSADPLDLGRQPASLLFAQHAADPVRRLGAAAGMGENRFARPSSSGLPRDRKRGDHRLGQARPAKASSRLCTAGDAIATSRRDRRTSWPISS